MDIALGKVEPLKVFLYSETFEVDTNEAFSILGSKRRGNLSSSLGHIKDCYKYEKKNHQNGQKKEIHVQKEKENKKEKGALK